jgi:hypothetical protein
MPQPPFNGPDLLVFSAGTLLQKGTQMIRTDAAFTVSATLRCDSSRARRIADTYPAHLPSLT